MRHTVGGAQKVVTLVRDDRVERGSRLEFPGERNDRRARVPGREHARPGVLRPAGRGDVEMHVARLQAEAVHGRQMPDRIARVGVLDELRARRRAGGEIEQHRVVGPRRPVGQEARVRAHERSERTPAFRRPADGDALDVAGEVGELLRVLPVSHDEFRLPRSSRSAMSAELSCGIGGNEHDAELHCGQHRHPKLRRRAEHHQEPVAALRAERAQAVGEPRRKLRESSAKVRVSTVSPITFSAVLAPCSPAASSASNHSSAQLNCSGRGQTKVVLAAT